MLLADIALSSCDSHPVWISQTVSLSVFAVGSLREIFIEKTQNGILIERWSRTERGVVLSTRDSERRFPARRHGSHSLRTWSVGTIQSRAPEMNSMGTRIRAAYDSTSTMSVPSQTPVRA
jgi:hypothetical protein